MKMRFVLAIALVTSLNSTVRAAAEEEKVLEFERQWCAAYLHVDADFMRKYVVDNFTLTNSRREVSTRADDEIAKGTMKYTVFENRDRKVRDLR